MGMHGWSSSSRRQWRGVFYLWSRCRPWWRVLLDLLWWRGLFFRLLWLWPWRRTRLWFLWRSNVFRSMIRFVGNRWDVVMLCPASLLYARLWQTFVVRIANCLTLEPNGAQVLLVLWAFCSIRFGSTALLPVFALPFGLVKASILVRIGSSRGFLDLLHPLYALCR